MRPVSVNHYRQWLRRNDRLDMRTYRCVRTGSTINKSHIAYRDEMNRSSGGTVRNVENCAVLSVSSLSSHQS